MKTQPPPPAALRDPQSMEMARIWIAEQGQHCSLQVGMYATDGVESEIAAWGMILADLTHHIASALEAEGLGAKVDLKQRIAAAFQVEVAAPTTDHATTPGSGAN